MALTLRTDQELDDALDALSRSEGLSKQEVIRRAVLDRHARSSQSRDVAAATERALARWGDVLHRLGTV